MTAAIVIPWRDGCEHRAAALEWVIGRYREEVPEWPVVLGTCRPGPFNRSEAILDGAKAVSADLLLVADGDVWAGPQAVLTETANQAEEAGWSVPHLMLHRLSQESTSRVLAGEEWKPGKMPLSTDNRQDSKPYVGNETGTFLAIRRDVLFSIPPDVRFVGWGQEDVAWGRALRILHGPPSRGRADLMHLWHPPQPRQSRIVGNEESLKLLRRYRASRSREEMRALVDESIALW